MGRLEVEICRVIFFVYYYMYQILHISKVYIIELICIHKVTVLKQIHKNFIPKLKLAKIKFSLRENK